MAIKVEREPVGLGLPHEQCCLCWRATPFWYAPRDVALCLSCAETAKASMIPSKETWCQQARERRS